MRNFLQLLVSSVIMTMTTMMTNMVTNVEGFAPQSYQPQRPSSLFLSTPNNKDDKTSLFGGGTGNPMMDMNAAAAQLKNLSPQDMERMVNEMENMNPLQKSALKAMGMDPEMMKKTLEMMRDNPNMVESAQKLMQNMTPEEMVEQSRLAQERMKGMTPEELELTSKSMKSIPKDQLDQAVDVLKEQAKQSKSAGVVDASSSAADEDDEDDEDDDDGTPSAPMDMGPGSSSDPKVIDAMYEVAVVMSEDTGSSSSGCTLAGFSSLPVIQLLSGDRDMDLSVAELKECWADGSLGATRVDRQGFERVWKEVQEFFEDDIMGEARKEAKARVSNKRGSRKGSSTEPAAGPASSSSSSSSSSSPATTTVGQNLTPDQLEEMNKRVKSMTDDDYDFVLDQMGSMDEAQMARMKAMGIDPQMMQRTAKMMKDNPMMKDAAREMMKNMSPDEMLKASQQAQEEMKRNQQKD